LSFFPFKAFNCFARKSDAITSTITGFAKFSYYILHTNLFYQKNLLKSKLMSKFKILTTLSGGGPLSGPLPTLSVGGDGTLFELF